MNLLLLLTLLLSSSTAPAPPSSTISAAWLPYPDQVTVTWQQPQSASVACLSKSSAGLFVHLGCFDAVPGPQRRTLPQAPADAAARPQAGEIYRVQAYTESPTGLSLVGEWTAPLVARLVWLPVVRK